MNRLSGAIALTAVLVVSAACGESDAGDGTDDQPSLDGSSSTSEAAIDDAVDDEAAIEATIADYDRALVTVNRKHRLTPQLTAVATESWADELLATYDDNLFSKDLEMVGRWQTKVETVSVEGDAAEVEVCTDGNEVYVVETGGDVPSGTLSQGRFPGTVSLVRESGTWKIDETESGEGPC